MLRTLWISSFLLWSELWVLTVGNRVATPLGVAIGTTEISRVGIEYYSFRNIRYATAERFKSPKLVTQFPSNPFNATGVSPMCPQMNMFARKVSGSEDCLFLHIFCPANATIDSQLPVLMYVHGGGFQSGQLFHGPYAQYIMDNNVVLVAIQYRLGLLGFLSTGDTVIPGNYGIKDMKAALQWTTRYISYFGGDPGRITVFGESSGAASTHFLLTLPATRDMVYAAVSASGSVSRYWSVDRVDRTVAKTNVLLKDAGCENDKSYTCLFEMTPSQLLKTAKDQFYPTIEVDHDEAVIPVDPVSIPVTKPWLASWANGDYMVYIMGMTDNDPALKNIRETVEDRLKSVDLSFSEENLQIVMDHYFPGGVATILSYGKFLMELMFAIPDLQGLRRHKGPRYCYHNEYRGEISLVDRPNTRSNTTVASHADELFRYFYRREDYSWVNPEETPTDLFVSTRMCKMLANFATGGNPGWDNYVWRQFSSEEPNILRMKSDGTFVTDWSVFREINSTLLIWDKILPEEPSKSPSSLGVYMTISPALFVIAAALHTSNSLQR